MVCMMIFGFRSRTHNLCQKQCYETPQIIILRPCLVSLPGSPNFPSSSRTIYTIKVNVSILLYFLFVNVLKTSSNAAHYQLYLTKVMRCYPFTHFNPPTWSCLKMSSHMFMFSLSQRRDFREQVGFGEGFTGCGELMLYK